jgi:class 3 adenylate cyclase
LHSQGTGAALSVTGANPVAQENDAERAVRAALAIQRALAELNRKNEAADKQALAARIAIDSGPVVVDATGEVFGDVPNVAARAQAEPGAVVVRARVSPVNGDSSPFRRMSEASSKDRATCNGKSRLIQRSRPYGH